MCKQDDCNDCGGLSCEGKGPFNAEDLNRNWVDALQGEKNNARLEAIGKRIDEAYSKIVGSKECPTISCDLGCEDKVTIAFVGHDRDDVHRAILEYCQTEIICTSGEVTVTIDQDHIDRVIEEHNRCGGPAYPLTEEAARCAVRQLKEQCGITTTNEPENSFVAFVHEDVEEDLLKALFPSGKSLRKVIRKRLRKLLDAMMEYQEEHGVMIRDNDDYQKAYDLIAEAVCESPMYNLKMSRKLHSTLDKVTYRPISG